MTWAIIKEQFESLHHWNNAPEEVYFLQHDHRHIFFVELWIEQFFEDRDIEYIQEKDYLNSFLENHFGSYMGGRSCEDVAIEIKKEWEKKYPTRKIKVSVFEDNENGCLID